MNRFLLALLLLAPCASYAQDNPDYDPDYNDDGCYAIQDVLGLLPLFGTCPDTTTNWACGDTLLYDGYWYETVQIGNQCWFAENLRAEHYANGVEIPSNLDDLMWGLTIHGATSIYGEGSTFCGNLNPELDPCNPSESLELYGRLYNWMAVDDPRGLCPQGWRVGSGTDWTILENHVLAQGLAPATALRSTNGWAWAAGTDDYGFTILPSGAKFSTGPSSGSGQQALFWSSDHDINGEAEAVSITSNSIGSGMTTQLNIGRSVRCIQIADIVGCTNPEFLEFNPLATTNNGSCVNPIIKGCMDENYLEFNTQANQDDGSCNTQVISCVPPTMDGYTYSTTQIGQQCWFAENLRTTRYADGSNIPEILDDTTWVTVQTGARCNYNNDSSNVESLGRLYNWFAVADSRGLCPAGWRVPSDSDWLIMEELIGVSPEDLDLAEAWRGEGLATKLRARQWPMAYNNIGTDDFGFSAMPCGSRWCETLWGPEYYWAGFEGAQQGQSPSSYASWWTSTPNGAFGVSRKISGSHNNFIIRNIFYDEKVNGHSIRCIQNPIIPGCKDSSFLEFNPEATVDDGTCLTPVILGCTNEYYLEYNPNANSDDGSCIQLSNPCTSPVMDGYTYEVVSIGWQCWLAENLRTKIYSNGDTIASDLTNAEWLSTTQGAWASYGEGNTECTENSPDFDACNDSLAAAHYGLLYNNNAIIDERGICPTGWKVPTSSEWNTLCGTIKESPCYGILDGWSSLKSTTGWSENGNGTDTYGFSALPGGYRADYSGHFYGAGLNAFFATTGPHYLALSALADNSPYLLMPINGLSVRCIKIND